MKKLYILGLLSFLFIGCVDTSVEGIEKSKESGEVKGTIPEVVNTMPKLDVKNIPVREDLKSNITNLPVKDTSLIEGPSWM